MRVPGRRFLVALSVFAGVALAFAGPAQASGVPQVARDKLLVRSHTAPAGAAWEAVRAASSSGPYNIFNRVTGKCVDIPGYENGTVDGPVNEYTCDFTSGDNQRFYLDWYDSSRFTIRNVKDGLCIDVPDYGVVPSMTAVSEYYCRPGNDDNQLYRLNNRNGGGDYWIINDKSGLCLDVDGVRTGGNDARLTLYPCSDNDDHIWNFLT